VGKGNVDDERKSGSLGYMKTRTTGLALALCFFGAAACFADPQMGTSVPNTFGRSRVSYGREECVALPPAPGTEIDSGRKDDEDDVCKIKFDDPNVILCPALYSTNPGTDIYDLPTGVSRASFEQKECAKEKGRNADFLAKYKQSTSCSYTPAILAYGKVADA